MIEWPQGKDMSATSCDQPAPARPLSAGQLEPYQGISVQSVIRNDLINNKFLMATLSKCECPLSYANSGLLFLFSDLETLTAGFGRSKSCLWSESLTSATDGRQEALEWRAMVNLLYSSAVQKR